MTNCITLHPLKDIDVTYACQLYESSFPIEERRDTTHWLAYNESKPQFNILCIKNNSRFQGILSYWSFDTFCYIEHFAISSQQRGTGIGSAALKLFAASHAQRPIILEVEPDTDNITHRRILFYKRHNFHVIALPYTQPPYHKGGKTFPLNIMCNDANFAKEHFNLIVKTIHQQVYNYSIN